MKTYRHLYDQICDWDNLYLAYRKARRGKRGRPPAATFEFDLESNLVELQRELKTKTYRPGAYSSFYIHEPKRRLISAAPFRDRVVHHALCNVIEPIFERSFIFDSYRNIGFRLVSHIFSRPSRQCPGSRNDAGPRQNGVTCPWPTSVVDAGRISNGPAACGSLRRSTQQGRVKEGA